MCFCVWFHCPQQTVQHPCQVGHPDRQNVRREPRAPNACLDSEPILCPQKRGNRWQPSGAASINCPQGVGTSTPPPRPVVWRVFQIASTPQKALESGVGIRRKGTRSAEIYITFIPYIMQSVGHQPQTIHSCPFCNCKATATEPG